MKRITKSQAGFSILVFLTLLLMLSLLGINAILVSTSEVDVAGYELNSAQSLNAAEAGLEKAAAEITSYYDKHGRPPDSLPTGQLELGNQVVTYSVDKPGVTQHKILEQGAYRGLYSLSDEYIITSTATSPGVKAQTTLTQTLDAAVVPIYQFAVFYEGDLEIAPGPQMTLGGRVHSNNDMYLQADNSLKIDSYTTAAGNIYHGRSPLSGMSTGYGDVLIKDAGGTYQNMDNGDGSWLDANDADWVDESISRWDGKVEDGDHGMTELELPVVTSGEPKDMIGRENGGSNPDSYEARCDLKLLDGQMYSLDSDSIWSNITADMISAGVLSTTTFYDGREGKDVTSWDINLGALGATEYWPESGIIYTACDVTSYDATRLVNGDELAGPLTVASENPVYTLGDYNTVQKKPASIMTDAYTVLSNNWDDGKSEWSLNNRQAGATQVNAAYMTGNKPSGSGGGSNYSGGFENLPRFLENWSGKNFKWIGSAVDLWEAQQATGYWGGSYYSPPNRDWHFDLDFLDPTKLPPGTPLISVVLKTGWSQAIAFGEEVLDGE
ncbi:MAG: hypothetical protein ABIJ61_10530 [bacterium]